MADFSSPPRLHTYCALCIARCGAVAVVENGRFTRLEPDPGHPTGQALCAKGRAAPELVYHPERLTRPLRRTGRKGDPDPGWEPIGWDAALDETAAARRHVAERHGPKAVAFTLSSPSTTAIGTRAASFSGWPCLRHPERGDHARRFAAGGGPSPPATLMASAVSLQVAAARCRISPKAAA